MSNSCPATGGTASIRRRSSEKLAADREHRIKAVCVVHNETSTGVTSRIPEIRAAIDRAGHPALFMVDTISSLASIDYRHDEWRRRRHGRRLAEGADAAAGPRLQRGLGKGAGRRARRAKLPRSYWDWQAMAETGQTGFFPYTPATNLLLRAARGADDAARRGGAGRRCSRRHARHAEATRRAVRGWGLEMLCADPREYSSSLTAVLVPDGLRRRPGARDHPRRVRHVARHRARQDAGKVFRIGHLGHFNDLMLCGTLCGVEMGLHRAGIPHQNGGVAAALDYLGAARRR